MQSCRVLRAVLKVQRRQEKIRVVHPFQGGISIHTDIIPKCSGTIGLGTGKPSRLAVDLDRNAVEFLEENKLKPKNHPGVYHLKRKELPSKFAAAAEKILLGTGNIKKLLEPAKDLRNYLWSRKLPIEDKEYKETVEKVERNIQMRDDILRPFLSEKQVEQLDSARFDKIRNKLIKTIYHWERITYDNEVAIHYLLAKSAGEYVALLQILLEIQRRDKMFQPQSLLDFGSGIGTSIWASNTVWPKSVQEVLGVDVSKEMNDLAELLLRGGNKNNDHGFGSLLFRQFLPQSPRIPYDLVFSAFSLLELPSLKDRLKVLDILWKKCRNYMVIVESGTRAGFQAVIEARDYVLGLDENATVQTAHVFSPCPHDNPCPRFTGDDSACKFYVKYKTLYPFHQEGTEVEVFSYVVLRKGPRSFDDERWPRLISNPLLRKKHCICRVCTKGGTLAEVLLTKNKHSETLYRVGRKSCCGDLLPVREIFDTDVSTQFNGSDRKDTLQNDEKDETLIRD